ncbi:MAG: TrkA-N domain protein [Methanomicrobiales archaeon 53_19]|jgi:trk system potassium uptake protein TrkA|uniref:potassium channel family protein n=1 Tax=Methanocalculus sp. TaxID=2004547 RepID=UPI000747E18D|nr:NAD-binding protein [Methanocalculus sp.]KUK69385.1 MAG: TrkA-N domain protein [Methanocalculus sp. 52_23]KUL04044.1 MAG: TrkA-N domain protein [Methanomicrobiales archaeon 53_19]HIJ06788.1 NAD(P)-binding domain-containing protein [Methanocalculus sp.]
MYIIVIGLGGIGRSLAAIAAENGDSVVIIDRDEERCALMLETYDLLAITGNATDKAILEDAGIDHADALVATTSDDAANLMTCWLAKRYSVPNVVSVVNHKEHSELFSEVGVRISENPDEIVARSLYTWAENPNTQALASIHGGGIFEITVEAESRGVNRKISDLDVKDFVIIAVHRAGELIIPRGDVVIRPEDVITVFSKKEAEMSNLRYLNQQFTKKI